MKNLIEGNIVTHHRYKDVILFEIMGKLSLIKLPNGHIIGVHTRLLSNPK